MVFYFKEFSFFLGNFVFFSLCEASTLFHKSKLHKALYSEKWQLPAFHLICTHPLWKISLTGPLMCPSCASVCTEEQIYVYFIIFSFLYKNQHSPVAFLKLFVCLFFKYGLEITANLSIEIFLVGKKKKKKTL